MSQERNEGMITEIFIDAAGLMYSKEEVRYSLDSEQIKTAEAWIKLYAYPIKKLNRKVNSYNMKHRAEEFGVVMNEHFNTKIFSPYITNGAFIQAAMNLGYEPFPVYLNSLNAYFCMGLYMPNKFIRPQAVKN